METYVKLIIEFPGVLPSRKDVTWPGDLMSEENNEVNFLFLSGITIERSEFIAAKFALAGRNI